MISQPTYEKQEDRSIPAPALPSRKPVFLEILSLRSFRYLWAGNGLAFMGEKVLDMTVAWLVLEMTNSKLLVGVVNGLPALSIVLFAILGGILADRSDRRALLMRTRLMTASLVFLAAVLVTAGVIELWHLIAIVILTVGLNSIDASNARTMVFDVVGKEKLLSATAMNSMARNSGYIIGPAAVGALIGGIGVGAALYLLSATYILALLSLLGVKTNARPKNGRKMRVLVDLLEGIAYIRRTPQVAWLIALTFTLPFAGVFFGMLPVYARDVLQVGPQGLGLMMAAFGAGALTSSTALTLRGRVERKGLVVMLASLGFAAGMVFLAFAPSFHMALAAAFIAGVSGLFWVNTTNTMVQAAVDEEMRGRVMGIFMIGTQMMSLGWLIGGILATLISNAGALIISAVIFSGFSLYVYARSKEVRNLN